jgi:acyl carrier protein
VPHTLTPEEISKIVLDILTRRKAVDRAAVGPDTTLISLGIDSLEGLEVIFALEDRFNITVSDDEATTMKTVGAVIAGVQRIVSAPPSPPALEK